MAARTLTRSRAVVTALVVAFVAAWAVTGPLTPPASAATTVIPVADVDDLIAAFSTIQGVNGNDGEDDEFTILLTADIDYTGYGTRTLQDPVGTDDLAVIIDGDEDMHYSLFCDSTEGVCGSLVFSDMGIADSLTFQNITINGFRSGVVEVHDSALTIANSTFLDNSITGDSDSAYAIWGGAIYARAYYEDPAHTTVTITDSAFINNTATAGNAYGGAMALYNAQATVDGSFFYGNTATALAATASGGAISIDGGSLYIDDSVFEANDAEAAPDEGYGGAIGLSAAVVSASGSTFEDNGSSGRGGAVSVNSYGPATGFAANDLTVFEDNHARDGGAVALQGTMAQASIDTVIFQDNSAVSAGGAMWIQSGTADVVASLFAGNSAERGGAVTSANSADVRLASSTLAENIASAGGGAVHAWAGALIELSHTTIAGNSAPAGSGDAYEGGQILNTGGSVVDLFATVVVDTEGGGVACSFTSGQPPISSGYNAIDDTSCSLTGTDDVQSSDLDANLGPLQFNGGPTKTMVPFPDSDLVDQVETGQDACEAETNDQRGVMRAQGDSCDIGAVETFPVHYISVPTAGGTVLVAVLNAYEEVEGTEVEASPIATAALSPAPPAGVALPYGALGLTIPVWDDGWPVDVYVETPAPTLTLWKLIDGEWIEYAGEQLEAGTVWSFRLIDGGDGDTDGDADSVIHDPIGAGIVASFTG